MQMTLRECTLLRWQISSARAVVSRLSHTLMTPATFSEIEISRGPLLAAFFSLNFNYQTFGRSNGAGHAFKGRRPRKRNDRLFLATLVQFQFNLQFV